MDRRRIRTLSFALGTLLAFSTAYAQVTVMMQPRQAPVTFKQAQQFSASVSGAVNNNVVWLVDGVAGGNATVGTISASGLYTPPAVAGHHTVTAESAATPSVSATADVWVTDYVGMYTFHGDHFRSGANFQEYALSSSTISAARFGKLFSYEVDGLVYAQPLIVNNLLINGDFHNVVYVATEHDSVYAFDADNKTSAPLWHVNFVDPAAGITTIPQLASALVPGEIGITATPVIDAANGTLYVMVSTVEHGVFHHRLHALDIITGAEKLGGPVEVAGSVRPAQFNPRQQFIRSALLFLNGVVYSAWASFGDHPPYEGWMFAHTANGTGTLHTLAIHCTEPSLSEEKGAGIWMSGGGPATDGTFIYYVTGNGHFNLDVGGQDEGDSIVKLTQFLQRVDYFTPANTQALDTADKDLGSSGIFFPPFQQGAPHPDLLLAGGKEGIAYVVDRDNMGKFNPAGDEVVQKITLGTGAKFSGQLFFTPAGWNSFVYFGASNDFVRAYHFSNGLLTPAAQSATSYGYPGTTPQISASSQTESGIVWTLDLSGYVGGSYFPPFGLNAAAPFVLHAYDGTTMTELYNSSMNAGRDTPPVDAIRFTTPTVSNGRVYVGGAGALVVYGLLP